MPSCDSTRQATAPLRLAVLRSLGYSLTFFSSLRRTHECSMHLPLALRNREGRSQLVVSNASGNTTNLVLCSCSSLVRGHTCHSRIGQLSFLEKATLLCIQTKLYHGRHPLRTSSRKDNFHNSAHSVPTNSHRDLITETLPLQLDTTRWTTIQPRGSA